MITVSPRQQLQHQDHSIYSFHLIISLILFVLTVYPYLFQLNNTCCLVAALPAKELNLKHSKIDRFDIIRNDEVITFREFFDEDSRHGTSSRSPYRNSNVTQEALNTAITYQQLNDTSVGKIELSALGRKYRIRLKRPQHWITEDFTIVALDSEGRSTQVPYKSDQSSVYEGFLEDDDNSRATILFNNVTQLNSAQVQTRAGIVIIEPTRLHYGNFWYMRDKQLGQHQEPLQKVPTKFYDDTLIVYNLYDHKAFKLNSSDTLPYGIMYPGLSSDGCTVDSNSDSSEANTVDLISKYVIPKTYKRRSKRGIELFVEQPRDRTRCTLHLVVDYLFYKNVGNGDQQTTINYLLALINRVNQIYLSTTWIAGDETTISNIGFTVQNITIHQDYTRVSSDDLHYNMQSDRLWGAREFLDNFSRYSPSRHYCLAHLLTYRQFDTPVLGLAYVASSRFGTLGGICSPVQQKGDAYYKHNTGISTSKGINGETLITRQADLVLAHELGHNLGAEHDTSECKPSSSNGGAYLMHPYAVLGFEKNNRFMSNCSRQAIGRVVKRKGPTCFVAAVDNVCGNGIVEDDEECDGGDIGLGHNDPCCDSSCRFTPGSQCSDRHSWCCSRCRIVQAGFPCRPAEEYNCKQASYCDGRSAECPRSPPVEDNTLCVNRGLCRSGECIPFCEARGLQSCLCTTQADACRLCCRGSINETCTPYDLRSPYLHDGVLCYRGICEKGRCEQPIQDVVERLWDVIEDITLVTAVKFLRDNIILVVIVVSIPVWCLITHYINEFDRRVKEDVITSILKNSKKRRGHPSQSPFLPRLFVGDGTSNANSAEELQYTTAKDMLTINGDQEKAINSQRELNDKPARFPPSNYGFSLPEGEEVILEPRGPTPAASVIEDPYSHETTMRSNDETNGTSSLVGNKVAPGIYSTRV